MNDSFRLMYDIFEYCKIIYIFDKFIKNGASYEKNNFIYNVNFYHGGVQYE